jgi:hypothetical protein
LDVIAKMPIIADKYGNSSSSMIPVCIASEFREAIKEKELLLLISRFGAGLSIGSASIKLDKNILLWVVNKQQLKIEYSCSGDVKY